MRCPQFPRSRGLHYAMSIVSQACVLHHAMSIVTPNRGLHYATSTVSPKIAVYITRCPQSPKGCVCIIRYPKFPKSRGLHYLNVAESKVLTQCSSYTKEMKEMFKA